MPSAVPILCPPKPPIALSIKGRAQGKALATRSAEAKAANHADAMRTIEQKPSGPSPFLVEPSPRAACLAWRTDRVPGDRVDASSSSSEDDARRRRGQVKSLTLDGLPTVGGVKVWLAGLWPNICASSKRAKRRTWRWARKVLTATGPDELQAYNEAHENGATSTLSSPRRS